MNKGSHFIGQPAYGQLINLLDRTGILESKHPIKDVYQGY